MFVVDSFRWIMKELINTDYSGAKWSAAPYGCNKYEIITTSSRPLMGSTSSKDSRPIATNGIECGVSRKTVIGKKIRNSIEILWPSCLNLGYWSMSGKKVKSGMSDWMWPIESPFLPPPHPHPLIPTRIIISPPFWPAPASSGKNLL